MSYEPTQEDYQKMLNLANKVNGLDKQMLEIRRALMTSYTLGGEIQEQEDLRTKCHDLLDLIIDIEASTIKATTDQAMRRNNE